MTIQELQIKYSNGEISYEQYMNTLNEIRNNKNESSHKLNSVYYIIGVGILGFLLMRKKL